MSRINYEYVRRGIGSYRIRKYFNGKHDPIFNCLVENDTDEVALRDVKHCVAALDAMEAAQQQPTATAQNTADTVE